MRPGLAPDLQRDSGMNEHVAPVLRSDLLRLVRQVYEMAQAQRARSITLVIGVPHGTDTPDVIERVRGELLTAGLADVQVEAREGARSLHVHLVEFLR